MPFQPIEHEFLDTNEGSEDIPTEQRGQLNSFASHEVTIPAGRLVFMLTHVNGLSGWQLSSPVVTGLGLTWDLVFAMNDGQNYSSLYRTVTPYQVTGAVAFDVQPGDQVFQRGWRLTAHRHAPLENNGADAIVALATRAASTTDPMPMPSSSDHRNATVGFIAWAGNPAPVNMGPGIGFWALGEPGASTSTFSEFSYEEPQTEIRWSEGGNNNATMVYGLELGWRSIPWLRQRQRNDF